MIEPIYLIIVLLYSLLMLSVIIQDFIIGAITAMGIIVAGIFLLSGGAYLTNFLTNTIGIINICFGSFVFLKGSLDQIQTF